MGREIESVTGLMVPESALGVLGFDRKGRPIHPIAGGSPALPGSSMQLAAAEPAEGKVAQLPQTTAGKAAGGPFIRHSRRGLVRAVDRSGVPFGRSITDALKPVGGYLAHLELLVNATGGSGTATASADAPYNALGPTILRDPYGQPVIQVDGGFALRLIDMYGGQYLWRQFGDPANQSAQFANTIATNGNFRVPFRLPLEIDQAAYGALPSMNASIQPSFETVLAASASVYTAAPTTLPTLAVTMDELYWAIPPEDHSLAPPDVGTTHQWRTVTGLQSIGSASSTRVQIPVGSSYLTTLILVFRDQNNARQDTIAGSQLSLWIDGVPILDAARIEWLYDSMLGLTGNTRPTGVLVFSFRDSVQQSISQADTFDVSLATTPGSLIEVSCAPWGTFSNGPATVTAIVGALYPRAGVPYGHLMAA